MTNSQAFALVAAILYGTRTGRSGIDEEYDGYTMADAFDDAGSIGEQFGLMLDDAAPLPTMGDPKAEGIAYVREGIPK